jgi:hypothetical protein
MVPLYVLAAEAIKNLVLMYPAALAVGLSLMWVRGKSLLLEEVSVEEKLDTVLVMYMPVQ